MENDNFQTDKALTIARFVQREESVTHLAYENEFRFYNAVKEGNEEEVRKIMLPLKNEKLGKLSKDSVRNMRYHLIITIALITRFCIEGGMLPEDAYTTSDIYIQQADDAKTEAEISKLHHRVIMEFTRKMKTLKKTTSLSMPVQMIIDYIYDHLHEKISLDEIADELGFSKSYLCGLFKKETGMTILSYINKRKLEAAKNMLTYSDYASIDISNYLSFSSHSHFITSFKKETGLTPKEFRNQHYRTHFTSD